jgi:hypothetical protein
MTEPHCPHAIASAADLSLAAFISRWRDADGCELANYQLFITDLCQLLGVPAPDPARDDTRDNAYVFERRVTFRHGDGSESTGRIDCYKRSAYVLEAKKSDSASAARCSTTRCSAPVARPKATPARCRPRKAGRRS